MRLHFRCRAPHNAGAKEAALASSSASSGYQNGHTGMAPAYLAADCQLVSDEGRHQLRSANSRTCVVRRTCSSYGDRCLAAADPRLWNKLPSHLRQTDISFGQFKVAAKDIFVWC